MGKVMSALGKRATKPLREFNLEERAMKEITKEKRPAAPWHESSAKHIKDSIQAQSEKITRRLEEKDDHLLDRLKKVYVTSEDPEPQQKILENPDRPLPTDRTVVPDLDYGFFEPKSVPYGKITLRDAVDAISKHQQDPELWTSRKVSHQYRLDTGLTEKLLHHFRPFVLVVPEDTYKVTSETLQPIPLSASSTLKKLTSGDNEAKNDVCNNKS